MITFAKNSQETLVQSFSTTITNHTSCQLAAIRDRAWTINLTITKNVFLCNWFMAIITTEAFSMTNFTIYNQGITNNRFTTDSASTLRILFHKTCFTTKGTISKLTECLKRSMTTRTNKTFLMVHLIFKSM